MGALKGVAPWASLVGEGAKLRGGADSEELIHRVEATTMSELGRAAGHLVQPCKYALGVEGELLLHGVGVWRPGGEHHRQAPMGSVAGHITYGEVAKKEAQTEEVEAL
ncbi:unnamed protein product [Ilex paraguariensis]|uniref:Uncharacterized protein n=2 Tax=Ilex paraguariensis TaxID=185542 RepID=A0ABC8SHK3_9AQUA